MNEDGVGDVADECNPELGERFVSVGQAMVRVGGIGMDDGIVFVVMASDVVETISVISETELPAELSWVCITPSDCVLAFFATGAAGRGSSAPVHTIAIPDNPPPCRSPFPSALLPFIAFFLSFFRVVSGGVFRRTSVYCTRSENKALDDYLAVKSKHESVNKSLGNCLP